MATTKRAHSSPRRGRTPQTSAQHRAKLLRDLQGATVLVGEASGNLRDACFILAEVAYQLDDALITRAALIGARLSLDVEFFEQFVIAVYDRAREQESGSEQPCA